MSIVLFGDKLCILLENNYNENRDLRSLSLESSTSEFLSLVVSFFLF